MHLPLVKGMPSGCRRELMRFCSLMVFPLADTDTFGGLLSLIKAQRETDGIQKRNVTCYLLLLKTGSEQEQLKRSDANTLQSSLTLDIETEVEQKDGVISTHCKHIPKKSDVFCAPNLVGSAMDTPFTSTNELGKVQS